MTRPSASAVALPLKYPGGKRSHVAKILAALTAPSAQPGAKPQGRYIDPFFGGGSTFFALRAAGFMGRAVLGDLNPDVGGRGGT